MLNVVLVAPEIAPNTGNIARLCVCNGLRLHLVHPLGFQITDKNLKRAGMDYWKHLDLVEYTDLEAFLSALPTEARLHFLSTKSVTAHWDAAFGAHDYLVFGSESRGLPDRLRELEIGQWLTIPMTGQFVRSLNLSSSVAVVVYEALRQTRSGLAGVEPNL